MFATNHKIIIELAPTRANVVNIFLRQEIPLQRSSEFYRSVFAAL